MLCSFAIPSWCGGNISVSHAEVLAWLNGVQIPVSSLEKKNHELFIYLTFLQFTCLARLSSTLISASALLQVTTISREKISVERDLIVKVFYIM